MTPENERLLQSLWTEQAPRLRAMIARRYDSELAEQAVAEAFTRLAADPVTPTVPILYRKTWSIVTDELRRKEAVVTVSLEDCGRDGTADSFPSIETAMFRADFDRAFRSLPRVEAEAFTATELRGLTLREAADVLDVHYATVSRRVDSARETLRKELA
ncbi:MAG: sigma-70 family RNA polymerase sigma factor [Dehalococcoidia bacterium]|nr:sigma-70 family RNA polymerase sigma factor [Dehalococcoidia bacterium]